jgi:hypothetical protein
MANEVERFFIKTQRQANGCLVWTAGKTGAGYGIFVTDDGEHILAHRWAYEHEHGRGSASGMNVCHKCDTPACVEHSCLFLGTQADNMADCAAKGRTYRGGPNVARHGITHPRAKLNDDKVRAIRRQYVAGEGVRALGREYGVAHEAIRAVVTGRTWKHVVAEPGV